MPNLRCIAAAALLAARLLCGADAAPEADAMRGRAEAGESRSQLQLGYDFFHGINGRRQSFERAAYWFDRAAQAGEPEAWFLLGVCLEEGLGRDRDLFAALECYHRAGEAGVVEAALAEARMIRDGIPADERYPELPPDAGRGMEMLNRLAAEGHPAAEREIGLVLLDRAAGEENDDLLQQALAHFERAAASGDGPACRMAAQMLLAGIGGAADPEKAVRLLYEAARAGEPEAVAQLAFCLEQGVGCDPAPESAFELYRQAAGQGVAAAQLRMGEYYLSGERVEAADVGKALDYFVKAADSQLPAAQFRLGVCYAEGIGVDKDPAQAADYFLAAARAGEKEAQFNLGCLFLKGEGIPEDASAAFFWFRQAAEAGDPRAQRQLAYCYFEGIGTEPDDRQALHWLLAAADAGDPEAIALLEGR